MVVCLSEHTQAKDDVIVMWSVWLFPVGQEEEAAVSPPSAVSRSQTGRSSASSAHAQYVPVFSSSCLTPVQLLSIRSDVLSVSLSVEGIDPSYQSDSQNRRCALHAAAQRGLLEVCYLLVQVSSTFTLQWLLNIHRTLEFTAYSDYMDHMGFPNWGLWVNKKTIIHKIIKNGKLKKEQSK